MLRTLSDYHKRIVLGLDEIRRLCASPEPDMPKLQVARRSLTKLSVERSRFINQVVIARLLVTADYATSRDMVALQNSFAANRNTSDQHISHWNFDAITADWSGYCRAASLI